MKNISFGDLYAGGLVATVDEDGKGVVVAQSDLKIMRWDDANNFNQDLNGFSDWRLPTRDELNFLFKNRKAIGGFAKNDYWSGQVSSRVDCAWAQSFEDDYEYQYDCNISNGCCVRLVRDFAI
jgi:hypothetical protein